MNTFTTTPVNRENMEVSIKEHPGKYYYLYGVIYYSYSVAVSYKRNWYDAPQEIILPEDVRL